MAKKEEISLDIDNMAIPMVETPIVQNNTKSIVSKRAIATREEDKDIINCLRNERVIVRYRPKQGWMGITNPRHVLSGGLAEGATRTFVVPRLSSGMYVNVLTDNEKKYLEEIMGLEYNALSIYKKENNFWDDSNENGISRVRLTK